MTYCDGNSALAALNEEHKLLSNKQYRKIITHGDYILYNSYIEQLANFGTPCVGNISGNVIFDLVNNTFKKPRIDDIMVKGAYIGAVLYETYNSNYKSYEFRYKDNGGVEIWKIDIK